MLRVIKMLSLLIIFPVVLCFVSWYASATEIENFRIIEELDVREVFLIEISNTYTENKSIVQAAANENGDFATFTYYQGYAQDKNRENSSKEKYLDIYDNNGNFVCELRFITALDPSLRMSGNDVYLIFYDKALVFNIVSREINYYKVDALLLYQETKSIELGNEFEAGKWKYELKKHQALGYRQLVRSSDTETQVLIDIPFQINLGPIYSFFGIAVFIVTQIAINRWKRNKKQKNFSIEGFYRVE